MRVSDFENWRLVLIAEYYHLMPPEENIIGYVDELVVRVPDDVVNEIPASFSDVTLDHLGVVNLKVDFVEEQTAIIDVVKSEEGDSSHILKAFIDGIIIGHLYEEDK
ncbi:hypothetical protein RND71_034509 [Anisodus tanguticus]|uniref:Uncharacterized protein n=1 Tax=Anisodus tanguticus TaxID=243964 RepID=A0AAE1R9T9_9SOLA|nr:hypothetical protein RND71_034509 [Anisodus tanguticus]